MIAGYTWRDCIKGRGRPSDERWGRDGVELGEARQPLPHKVFVVSHDGRGGRGWGLEGGNGVLDLSRCGEQGEEKAHV